MAKKKRAAATDFDDDFEDDDTATLDDAEDLDGDEEIPDIEPEPPRARGRDWRDIERYREERELRALIDDDLYFDLDD